MASFAVTVEDERGDDFTGRQVKEVGTGGVDQCWQEYQYGKSVVPIPSYPPFTMGSLGYNTYGDYIGYYSSAIQTIVANVPPGGIPCGYTNYQTMEMLYQVTWQVWSTNVVSDTITDTAPHPAGRAPAARLCASRSSREDGNRREERLA